MDLSTLYYRNRYLLFLTVAVIGIGGWSALANMPRLEDPVITTRNVQILTPVPGADAARVEALVAKPIEKELRQIPEIKTITSTSRSGIGVVSVELRDEVDDETNDAVFSEIRDKLDTASAEFPEEALDSLVKDQRGPVAFTVLAALGWEDGSLRSPAILDRLSEDLAERLRNVPGTDFVERYGIPEEEIRVTVDAHELAALGLSFNDLREILEAADAKVPAGFFRDDGAALQFEVGGEFDSTGRIARVPLVTQPDGSVVRLGDVARIERGSEQPPTEIAFSGGQRRVYVGARVRKTERVDLWAAEAKTVIADFEALIGEGLELEVVFDQNEYTSARLGELASNLLLGALVVFVVIVFSMGWRSGLVVGSALPFTAALSLFVISITGGKLHQMSIFGMIIALGLLIDNAIVVTDEINRRLREGAERQEAVRRSVRHLFVPLLSSSATTILAFMPILLLPGNAGDFVGSIGGSVIVAIASSFFVAMTLVASLAGTYARRGGSADEADASGWWSKGLGSARAGRRITEFLETCVRRPAVTLPAASSVSFVGFGLALTLGSQFFPRVDRDMFEVGFWLSPEAPIQKTRKTAESMDALIRGYPGVREVHWLVGASFPSVYYNMLMNKDDSPFYAQGIVYADDFQTVKRLIPEIQHALDERFPEAQPLVRQFAQGPPAEADVEFRLLGPDINRLKALAERVREPLSAFPTVLHTRTTMETGQGRVRFEADEEDVTLAGMRLTGIAAQLQGGLEGFTAGSVIEGVQELPVRIQLPDTIQADFAALRTLPLPAGAEGNQWAPLEALGSLRLVPEAGTLTRRNAERMNAVRGWVLNDALPIEATEAVTRELEANGFSLPPGYRMEVGGDSENQAEAVGNLMLYVPVLVALTLATIVLSFRSVRLAALLFLVAGLTVGWGLLATWCMGFPLSFNTILGSLGLVGLAFNDNIVVLASIRADERARNGDPAAIARAATQTLRHLISTTLTTIGGFLPLLVFVGGDFWPPLAIVLAGGVAGCTLLALFFAPTAYLLLRPWKPVHRYFA